MMWTVLLLIYEVKLMMFGFGDQQNCEESTV